MEPNNHRIGDQDRNATAAPLKPLLLFIWCTGSDVHAHTQSMGRGPVLPAGLSAFSLQPRHLHTNTVCQSLGTNTRHSTFHYRALIIEGWEVAREAEKTGKEDRGRSRVQDDRLFYFLPSLKTHLGPGHAQLKTSLRRPLAPSNTDIVRVHLLLHSLCLFSPTSSSRSKLSGRFSKATVLGSCQAMRIGVGSLPMQQGSLRWDQHTGPVSLLSLVSGDNAHRLWDVGGVGKDGNRLLGAHSLSGESTGCVHK